MKKYSHLFIILFIILGTGSCILYDWPEGNIFMITPFVNAADITSINEAYSTHSNCPWGFEHRGIDFMISQDRIPFQAVCDGVVRLVEKKYNDGNGFWQVNLIIKYNQTFKAQYVFEPFSGSESDGDAQMDSILVSRGDKVRQGDIIGYLLYKRPGAHVDFSLNQDGDEVCPETYFTATARQAIYTILQNTIPNSQMCYE